METTIANNIFNYLSARRFLTLALSKLVHHIYWIYINIKLKGWNQIMTDYVKREIVVFPNYSFKIYKFGDSAE